MKYLQDYVNDAQTEAFDKAGAFFAFSNSQFNEKKVDGVKYADLGYGLICPVDNSKELIESLNAINTRGVQMDIEENGIVAIIKRELDNHEASYTGDIESTVDALTDYPGITVKMIQDVFSGKEIKVA